MMKLQPLKSYRAPEYPTQECLRQESEMLRTVPRRWRGNRAVLSVLAGALALMNQSCTSSRSLPSVVSTAGKPNPPRSALTEEEVRPKPKPKPKPDRVRWMGKVAVPQTVIPEDEAKASQKQVPSQPTHDWVPIRGKIAVPRSAIPEDEAKATADQAAKAQPSPSH